jgi:histone acetyltransferase (RNA polymerase elongator complex component)
LNPADDHHQPKIGEFVAIIQDTGDTTPVDVLCGIFGGRFVTRSNDRKPTLMAAVLHAMSEHSDIARAIEDALADNVITPTERMAIYRQIAEARQALVTLENTLAADNVIVIEPPKGA